MDTQGNILIPISPIADPPSDPFDAWTEAEGAAMRILCEATGHTLGQSAFIGETLRNINSFCLYNDATQNGGEVFYADRLSSFVLPYVATGLFAVRRDAQRWAMKIACALPVRCVGNLDMLRISGTGIGALAIDDVNISGETAPRRVWRIPVNLDLVVRVL